MTIIVPRWTALVHRLVSPRALAIPPRSGPLIGQTAMRAPVGAARSGAARKFFASPFRREGQGLGRPAARKRAGCVHETRKARHPDRERSRGLWGGGGVRAWNRGQWPVVSGP